MRAICFVALLACGCDAPKTALVQRCKRGLLSTETRCELSAQKLTRNQTVFIEANTKNLKVHVDASFTVTGGRVTVVFMACGEGGRVDVVPGAPVKVSCDAAVNRNDFSFPVDAWVGSGGAEGLAGELTFRAL